MGGATPSTLGFTGEQTDTNNLLYLRARYYDPALGTFLSRDAHMGAGAGAQYWNSYLYALNNPLRYIDPSGMDAISDISDAITNWIVSTYRQVKSFDVLFGGFPISEKYKPAYTPILPGLSGEATPSPSQTFTDFVMTRFQMLNNASRYSRMFLGLDPIAENMTRLQVAGEAFLGAADVLSGGSVSDIRSGDPLRMAFGVIGLAGSLYGGYKLYREGTKFFSRPDGYLEINGKQVPFRQLPDGSIDIEGYGIEAGRGGGGSGRPSIRYGDLDEYGRPTLVRARLDPANLSRGAKISKEWRPVEFKFKRHDRTHLLAREFGGNGSAQNRVIGYWNVNQQGIWEIEDQIGDALSTGEIINYVIQPIYPKGNGTFIPSYIAIRVYGNKGTRIAVMFINKWNGQNRP